jgi:hypothetical protein
MKDDLLEIEESVKIGKKTTIETLCDIQDAVGYSYDEDAKTV